MTLVGRIRCSGCLWRERNRQVRIIQVAHIVKVTGSWRCVGISRVPGTRPAGGRVTGFIVRCHAAIVRSAAAIVNRSLRAIHGSARSGMHGGLAGERGSVVATRGCRGGVPGVWIILFYKFEFETQLQSSRMDLVTLQLTRQLSACLCPQILSCSWPAAPLWPCSR